MDAIPQGVRETRGPTEREIKTYRYLRVAMVLMAVGLGASVVYERVKAREDCWQTSISAYYYTPVEGFFVAALVTIGVCLIALKAATDHEDVVLNLAGACAPFVAFVPTPTANPCGYNLTDEGARDLSVGNNVFALLVIAALTLVVTGLLSSGMSSRLGTAPSPADRLGFLVAVVLFIVTAYVFFAHRPFFIRWGHPAAAIAMFVFIAVVVLFNARQAKERPLRVVYGSVFAGMVVAAVVNGLAGRAGWPYWVLSIEACLIVLFVVFWVVQTLELWNQGVRLPADGSPDHSSGARTRPTGARLTADGNL